MSYGGDYIFRRNNPSPPITLSQKCDLVDDWNRCGSDAWKKTGSSEEVKVRDINFAALSRMTIFRGAVASGRDALNELFGDQRVEVGTGTNLAVVKHMTVG